MKIDPLRVLKRYIQVDNAGMSACSNEDRPVEGSETLDGIPTDAQKASVPMKIDPLRVLKPEYRGRRNDRNTRFQ